jgi:hypothetical protein
MYHLRESTEIILDLFHNEEDGGSFRNSLRKNRSV